VETIVWPVVPQAKPVVVDGMVIVAVPVMRRSSHEEEQRERW
jgi:hypothetical protein